MLHYAPSDHQDHSDDIRIRVLRDRAEKAEAEIVRLNARIAKFEEKLRLAKSLLWRETDEAPITILDVEP